MRDWYICEYGPHDGLSRRWMIVPADADHLRDAAESESGPYGSAVSASLALAQRLGYAPAMHCLADRDGIWTLTTIDRLASDPDGVRAVIGPYRSADAALDALPVALQAAS